MVQANAANTFWYSGTLCFQDKSKLIMKSNYYMVSDFKTFYISIDSCNNATHHDLCKPEAEIDEFLMNKKVYLAT